MIQLGQWGGYQINGFIIAIFLIKGGRLQNPCACPDGGKGGDGIGRAKSVPADRYVEAYAQLVRQMEEQISAVAEKGEEAL